MKSAILDHLRENFEITGDNAVMVLDTYCQTLERHVRELGAAINDEDILKIRAVTHSMMGCSSNVGAISILKRAGEINPVRITWSEDIEHAMGERKGDAVDPVGARSVDDQLYFIKIVHVQWNGVVQLAHGNVQLAHGLHI